MLDFLPFYDIILLFCTNFYKRSLTMLLYIDPAATSILITSITSIAVALGATFIILWRKFKKGVKKTFKIDENAGKELEEEVVVYDENTKEQVKEQVKEQTTETFEEPKKDDNE